MTRWKASQQKGKHVKQQRHDRRRWAGSRAGGRGWADLKASIEKERETPISG